MKIRYWILSLVLIGVSVLIYQNIPYKACVPQTREIVLTFDDLPLEQVFFENIVQALLTHKAPAVGFVIANQINDRYLPHLNAFLNAGFLIGNHSYSHPDLNNVSAEFYVEDLDRADKLLNPLMRGTKYFRYPYLAEGKWLTKKKILNYLNEHQYVVAPITIDSRDFEFNREFIKYPDRYNPKFLSQLKQRYLKYVWDQTEKVERSERCNSSKQILLLHANALNSLFLDDLLTMYEQQGYHFIKLGEALGN
jgi:peptidoglycan/xylan/chitin deacetylase (PgdA/CDA1 family)